MGEILEFRPQRAAEKNLASPAETIDALEQVLAWLDIASDGFEPGSMQMLAVERMMQAAEALIDTL